MKSIFVIAALTATMATSVTASAQTTAPTSQERTYHGPAHHYRYHCKKSSGTTGLIAGAGGGGLGAAALGAGPVGIAAGVVGGGLLGRHLDKRHDAAQNRKNGC